MKLFVSSEAFLNQRTIPPTAFPIPAKLICRFENICHQLLWQWPSVLNCKRFNETVLHQSRAGEQEGAVSKFKLGRGGDEWVGVWAYGKRRLSPMSDYS